MLTLVDDAREHTHAAPGQAHGDGAPVDLDELCRVAAQQMLAVALEAERRAYLAAHADVRGDDGHRLVVGNGHHRPREITTAAGRVEVTAPRVDDRRDGHRFTSAILPPYMRRSPKVTEVLPVLYLRGLSTNDFVPALEGFFGSAAGLSPSTIQRLTEAWRAEHARWCQRDLSAVDYVYVWADGIYVNCAAARHRRQRRSAVFAGDRRGAPRRHQGVGGGDRRAPRGHRIMAGSAA